MAKVYLGDWGTYYKNSGTSSPSTTKMYDFQTRWYITYEQDLSAGKTTIYVQPYIKLYYPSTGVLSLSQSTEVGTTINGSTKTQYIQIYRELGGATTTSIWGKTQTFTITHESDGTASCKFSGYMAGADDDSTLYRKTASHTWALPTINVASTITNNTTDTARVDFGKDVTFTIKRPNTSITHTLKYKVGNTEYTIGTNVGESITYKFPTTLIANYPSNNEVAIAVDCISSNGTTSTTAVYLKVPDSYVPTISLALSDVGTVPSNWGIYVQTKTKLKGVITASGSAGSTIKRYSATANNQTYSTNEFTTSELTTTGKMTINASVVDTRDRTASTSQTINVIEYSVPTYTKTEIVRCDSEGNDDEEGTYGRIECTYKISSCENKNAKILQVIYGEEIKEFTLENYSGTFIASADQLFENLDETANHTFLFKLIDSFTPAGIQQSFVLPPSYVLVSKRAGGKGIAFGRIATKDGFHNYLDSFFHESLMVNSIKTKNLINLENPTPYNAGSLEFSKETVTFKSAGTYAQLQYILYDLEPNTEYTLSYDFTANDMTSYETNMEINGNGSWQNQIGNVIGYGTKQITFNSGNYDYITLVFPICGSTFIENTGFLSNLQLEKGNEVSEYSEFLGVGFTSGKNEKGSWIKFDDGTLVCRGIFEIPANTEKQEIYFPTNFINDDYQVFMTNKYNYSRDVIFSTGSLKTNYFNVFPTINGAKPTVITNAQYVAIGYWK